jgi:hypothetical protein
MSTHRALIGASIVSVLAAVAASPLLGRAGASRTRPTA